MPRNEFQAEIIPYEPDAVNADEGIVIIQDISHQDQTFDKHIFRSSLKAASIIVLSLKKISYEDFSQQQGNRTA